MQEQVEQSQLQKTIMPVVNQVKESVTAAAQSLPKVEVTEQVSLANALGIVSLALGAVEVLNTKNVARKAGLDPKYMPIVRAFGVREIVSGLGLLAGKNKKAWLWSRVAGDVLDSALLGYAYYNERQPDRRKKIVKAFTTISPIVAADVVAVIRAN